MLRQLQLLVSKAAAAAPPVLTSTTTVAVQLNAEPNVALATEEAALNQPTTQHSIITTDSIVQQQQLP